MSCALFISYRRGDAQGYALDLYKSLLAHFRDDAVFFDRAHSSLTEGDVFLARIDQALADARVVLVLISHGWAEAIDAEGRLRLHQPDDVVRREIRAALSGTARVVPVLFDGAPMPSAAQLPADIAALRTRDALMLDSKLATRDAALAQWIEQITVQPGIAAARRVVVRPRHQRVLDRFRNHYLGATAAATPPAFVGRRAERQALDDWLADPLGAPQCLLYGPAATGKTSLLLHWLQARAPDDPWHVVLLPISVRFDTNNPELFWAMAASQLGAWAGVSAPGAEPRRTADDALDITLAALDRLEADAVRLLIVIDGLDEAAGWKLPAEFRARSAPTLRWLVSVRAGSDAAALDTWLSELGWRRDRRTRLMALAPLARADVVSAAWQQRGDRALAEEVPADGEPWQELGEALWRVSHGDPLLLGYYLDDLAAADADDSAVLLGRLQAATPGFADYFKLWLTEQRPYWQSDQGRSDRLDALLTLLGSAMGPLPLEALDELLPRAAQAAGAPAAAAPLNRSSLSPLQRFVIEAEGGYVLAHPRLAETLEIEFPAQGRWMRSARSALLDWCRERSRCGQALPQVDAGSVYVGRHFAQHLVQATQGAADLLELASANWMRASLAVDESGRQLVADLELARTQVEARALPGEPLTTWRLIFGLARTGVQTRARVEPELLAAYARLGLVTVSQVLRRLELMAPRERAVGLALVAATLAAHERGPLLEQALDAVRRVNDFDLRMATWAQVSACIADPEARDRAELELLAAMEAAPHLYGWLKAVDEVAPRLAEPALRRLMWQCLAQVNEPSDWDVIEALWPHLPPALHDEGLAAVAATAGVASANAWHAAGDRSTCLPDAALALVFAHLSPAERDGCWRRLLAHGLRSQDHTARVRAICQAEPWLLATRRGKRVRAQLARFQAEYRNEYVRFRTYVAILREQLSPQTADCVRALAHDTLQKMSSDSLRLEYTRAYARLATPTELDRYAQDRLERAPAEWRWKELAVMADGLSDTRLREIRARASELGDAYEAALAEAVLLAQAGSGAQGPDAADWTDVLRRLAARAAASDEVHERLVMPIAAASRAQVFGDALATLAGDADTLMRWDPHGRDPGALLEAIDRLPFEGARLFNLFEHRHTIGPHLAPGRVTAVIEEALYWNEFDQAVSWMRELPDAEADPLWSRLEKRAAEGVHGHVLNAACHLIERDRSRDPERARRRLADLRARIDADDEQGPNLQQAARLLALTDGDARDLLLTRLQVLMANLKDWDLKDSSLLWPALRDGEASSFIDPLSASVRRLARVQWAELGAWLVDAPPMHQDAERALLNLLPELLAEAPRATWLRVVAARAPQWRALLGDGGLRELAAAVRSGAKALP